MESWSLNQLLDTIANTNETSPPNASARAELVRRETLLNERVAESQIAAAEATIETAKSTSWNAKYLLYSVWAILGTSAITALVTIVTWLVPRQ
jgi:acetamidase/formamidase